MQALIIAYESPGDFDRRRGDRAAFKAYIDPWFSFSAALDKSGAGRGGEALQGPETATSVSVRNGVSKVEDGPFLDAKEQIGGFFLIEVPTLKDAVDWATRCPAAETGAVEVREVPVYGAAGSGAPRVEDGPFTDAKEQLGGYYIIDAKNLDEALDWAAKCPAAATETVEVRPVWQVS